MGNRSIPEARSALDARCRLVQWNGLPRLAHNASTIACPALRSAQAHRVEPCNQARRRIH
jgi:hypothetical protein